MTASQSPYRYRVMRDTADPVTFDTPGAAAGHLAAHGYDLSCQPSAGIVVYTCGDRCAAILRVRPTRQTLLEPAAPTAHTCPRQVIVEVVDNVPTLKRCGRPVADDSPSYYCTRHANN